MSESPAPAALPTPAPISNDPTPAPAPAPAPAAEEKPYYDAFPDDLKANPAVVKYKTAADLARGLVAAENRLGTPADQLVRLPKGLDDKEGLAAVFKALGTPDTPDGYKLEFGEGITDADKAAGLDFVKHMHDAVGAPPMVIKAAVDWLNKATADHAAAETAATATANQAAETALKTEWGAAYEPKMREIGRLLTDLGGPELMKELDASRLGSNVQLMTALGKVLDKVAEPGSLTGEGRGVGQNGVLTPGQAKAEIAKLENDPIKKVALNDANHSMHKAVLEERRNLYKLASGQPAT